MFFFLIKKQMKYDSKQIAKMIDHALLHPTMTDEELTAGCRMALTWDVASVCIKPYAVEVATRILEKSDVKVCTVIGFPHGANSITTKITETVQAISDGATEIDMVVNIGKALNNNWNYLNDEISTINEYSVKHGAVVKVIFENDYLPDDASKIQLTELCRRIGVAFVKTSTGFGYTRQPNGMFATKGATLDDCRLMVSHAGPAMKVKAAGGIRTFADLLAFKEIGVARIGTTATEQIMNECRGVTVGSGVVQPLGY